MKLLYIVIVFSAIITSCASRHGGGFIKTKSEDESSVVTFSGGNGDSPEEAVIINGVHTQSEGLAAEYQFISTKHGEKDEMWSVVGQSVAKEKTNVYDIIEIRLNDENKSSRIYYFDITSFPWKTRELVK